MAVLIDWGLIVGSKTVDDGGYVGDLMNLAKGHIDKSVIDNRITKAQAGEVYVTMISAAISGGISFGMDKQLKEADIAIKESQLATQRNSTEAELEKQWGYEVTRDVTTDELILGTSTGLGKIDEELKLVTEQIESANASQAMTAQQELTEVQNTAKLTYEVTNLLPVKLIQLEEQIDLVQSQDLDILADIVRKDTVTEQDLLNKQEQIIASAAGTLRNLNESTSNIALVTEKVESEALNNKVDGLLENQIAKMKEEVEISKTKVATEQANSIANIAKVLGYEYTLDLDGNIVVGTSTGVGKLDYELDLVKEQIESEALRNAVDGLIPRQIDEVLASTTRENAKSNADIAIKAQNEISAKNVNGGYIVTYTYYVNGWSGATATTTDISSVVGSIVSTSAVDGAGIAIVDLEKHKLSEGITTSKVARVASILDAQLRSWTSIFNSSKYDESPTLVSKASIDATYTRLKGI